MAFATTSASRTSASRKSTGKPSKLSLYPVDRSSRTRTRMDFDNNNRTRLEPMNPAPPVTSAIFCAFKPVCLSWASIVVTATRRVSEGAPQIPRLRVGLLWSRLPAVSAQLQNLRVVLGERQIGIYPWGELPARLFAQIRELEAYATVRDHGRRSRRQSLAVRSQSATESRPRMTRIVANIRVVVM